MYNQTHWLDDVPGIGQEGTPQSAGNFNNMENGIQDVSVAAAQMMIFAKEIENICSSSLTGRTRTRTVTMTENAAAITGGIQAFTLLSFLSR